MIKSQECKIVDASLLVRGGILDSVSTPVDGKDRHLYIGGSRVDLRRAKVGSVTVQAAYLHNDEVPGLAQPTHRLSINLKNPWYKMGRGQGRQANFSLRLLDDGQYGVSTVSGTSAGHAPLGAFQSRIVTELIDQSIGSENISPDANSGDGTPTVLAKRAHIALVVPELIIDNT